MSSCTFHIDDGNRGKLRKLSKDLFFLITFFVGLGIYALGFYAFGNFFKAAGALVGFIGFGITAAGYLYPPSSNEINQAVEDFEER